VPTIVMCAADGSADPEQCFEDFLMHINSNEFEEADACIYNYETLGFAVPDADSLYTKMFNCLQQSRTGNVQKIVSQQGNNAVLEVELTTLDYRKLEIALAQLTKEKAQEAKMDGLDVSEDAQIKQIMSECFDQIMQNPQEQYTSSVFELEFVKRDGRWLIVCTEEFYSALIGYAM